MYYVLYKQFSRIYKAGSSIQGGTLLQLYHLINHCNVSANATGWFNETIDFFNLLRMDSCTSPDLIRSGLFCQFIDYP